MRCATIVTVLVFLLAGGVLVLVALAAAGLEDEAHPDIDFTTETRADGTVVVLWHGGGPVFQGTKDEAERWIAENPPVREDYTAALRLGAAGGLLIASGLAISLVAVVRRRRAAAPARSR